MDKSQQKKLVGGIGSVVLLFCMILGGLVYNQSPQNEQKGTTTITTTRPSLPSRDKGNIAPSPDSPSPGDKGTSTTTPDVLQPVGLCAVYVNNMYNAAFLGFCGYLIISLFSSGGLPTNPTLFKLSILHYLVAALVGYIVYFFYQNYGPANKLPPYSLPKDMSLIALMGVLTGMVFVAFSGSLVTKSEKRLKGWQNNVQTRIQKLQSMQQKVKPEILKLQNLEQEVKKKIQEFQNPAQMIKELQDLDKKAEQYIQHLQSKQKVQEEIDQTKNLQKEIKKKIQDKQKEQEEIEELQALHKEIKKSLEQQQQIKKDLQSFRFQLAMTKVLNRPLVVKILISCCAILVAYTIAINVITYLKSNHKIKRRNFDSMRLFSMFILTGICSTMVDKSKSKIASMLLWSIVACFLYVQAFWEPKSSAIGHKKIGVKIVAWLSHSSHLGEGLAASHISDVSFHAFGR